MKRLGLLAALFLPVLVFAAAQIPERLRFDGLEEQLMATPLEDYWNDSHPKPASLTQTSLSCWRGYVGTWEIIDKKLYLLKLVRHEIRPQNDTFVEQTIALPVKALVGRPAPVLATWFSGVLRVARGDVIAQVNAGFASVYQEDVYFIVDKGTVVSERVVKNDPARVTSDTDLAWRELARISPTGGVRADLPEDAAGAEQGNWLGLPELQARAADLVNTKASFQVRGIRFPGRLCFPGHGGQDTFYPLDTTGMTDLPSEGVAVEATCTLVKAAGGCTLVASEIIELPPGLAIQRSLAAPATSPVPSPQAPRLAEAASAP